MENNFKWFKNNYESIFSMYGHTFVAIIGKKIIGNYTSYKEAIETTSKLFPLGSFIVQECNGDSSGYTNYIASVEISVI